MVMWTLPPLRKLYIYSQRNLAELNLLTAMRIVTKDVSQEVTPAKKIPIKGTLREISHGYFTTLRPQRIKCQQLISKFIKQDEIFQSK